MSDEIQENELFAESIFGAKTGRGLVKLSHGISWEIYISPEEARFYAMSILEAATAAETDEILMLWLRDAIGIKDQQKAVLILRDFRQIRIDIRRRELAEAKAAGTENKP